MPKFKRRISGKPRVFPFFSALKIRRKKEYALSPKCIAPECLNSEGGVMLSNTYNLSPEAFEIYKNVCKNC